jgi:hypothetical protein
MREPISELTGTYESDPTPGDGRMIMKWSADWICSLIWYSKHEESLSLHIKNLLPLPKVKGGNKYREKLHWI